MNNKYIFCYDNVMMLSRPSNDVSREEGGAVADLLRCFPAGRREVLWQIY
jgi:hypothetical protein